MMPTRDNKNSNKNRVIKDTNNNNIIKKFQPSVQSLYDTALYRDTVHILLILIERKYEVIPVEYT